MRSYHITKTELVERITLGLNKARARGVRIGRPPLAQGKMTQIIELHSRGWTGTKIAAHLNISRTTVYRHLPLED